jgi:hypothetical protein
MKIGVEDINDLITNVDDQLYLKLLEELVGYETLEGLLVDHFYNLDDDEQEELLKRFSRKLNEKEQTNEQ